LAIATPSRQYPENQSDLSTEMIQVNLKAVLDGVYPDVQLAAEKMWLRMPVSMISKMKNMYRFWAKLKRPESIHFPSHEVEELMLITSRRSFRKSANSQDIERKKIRRYRSGTLSDIIPAQVEANYRIALHLLSSLPFDQVIVQRKRSTSRCEKLVGCGRPGEFPGIFAIADQR